MEIWKDVIGYERFYQVSNLGNVKSLDRSINQINNSIRYYNGKLLNKKLESNGYYRVNLNKEGLSKNFSVHRLVAIAFIENSKNKPQVNHINGIKTDNFFENLEWTTISENTKHAYENKLIKKRLGEKHPLCKIKAEDVHKIKYELNHLRNFEVAIIFNIKQCHVKSIRKNYTWKHI